MRRLLLPLLLVLAAPAGARDWPHTTELTSRLAWVHPLVNYEFPPEWRREWERHLLRGGALRLTVGSVSTDDFLTLLDVNLDQPLSGRFRFLYRGTWRAGLHLDDERQEHWLGFEAAVAGPLAAFAQAHPTPDKEEMDLRAGVLLADPTRERYLRVHLRWDDFLYGNKNDRGGVSEGERTALGWELRLARDEWELVSRGDVGGASARVFPDAAASPDLAARRRDADAATVTLRRMLGGGDLLALGADRYAFAADETWRGADGGYAYDRDVLHVRALAVLGAARTVGLRPEFHWLHERATGRGFWAFDHDRTDVFPALFLQWRPAGHSNWEVGYMACHHSWTSDAGDAPEDVAAYTDKVKLGWIFSFTPAARLQVSLSHEVDLQRFGGGNVQFQTRF